MKKESAGRETLSAPPPFESAFPMILRIARIQATGVVRAFRLPPHERDDLEQEAVLHVWRKLRTFNPRRSSLKTFVERIVSNKMISLVRGRRAAKRNGSIGILKKNISETHSNSLLVRMDVRRLLDSLPSHHKRICLLLCDSGPAEVSRRERISRASVYRVIHDVRVVFTQAGMGHSLGRK